MSMTIKSKVSIKGKASIGGSGVPVVKTYKADFKGSSSSIPDSPGYNIIDNLTSGSTFNLVSDIAEDEGYQLELLDNWLQFVDNSAYMSGDQFGFSAFSGQSAMIIGGANSPASFKIKNLPNGATYSLSIIGQNTGTAARDADFTVLAETKRYDNTTSSNPIGTPVVFTGTVAGGEIIVTQEIVSDYAYMNAFILTIST